MSSGRSTRKRGVAATVAVESETKRSTRSVRKPVKIEVEEEKNDQVKVEEETTSKYFELGGKQDEDVKVKVEVEGNEMTEDESAKDVEKKPKSPGKKKVVVPVKVEPPPNWEMIMENIKTMRSSKTAAVDTMGCERTADLTEDPKVQRFQTLVSLMLSSQTKDQVTFAAMDRLKERGLTVQAMLDVNETELEEILKPVSFFRRKTVYIKKTAAVLREQYDDDIPKTVEDLCSLPGVGPKMAYICMNAAWGENVGIGVDTHVHRISNRLKWTGKKGTSTPEKTREALESWMPRELWQEFNIMLVGFGQETCLPIGPKCGSCLNKDICPSSTAKQSKSKK